MLSAILNRKNPSSFMYLSMNQAVFLRPQMSEAIWDCIHVQMDSNLLRQRDEGEGSGQGKFS